MECQQQQQNMVSIVMVVVSASNVSVSTLDTFLEHLGLITTTSRSQQHASIVVFVSVLLDLSRFIFLDSAALVVEQLTLTNIYYGRDKLPNCHPLN